MFQETHKIILGVLLFTVVIYVFGLIYTTDLPHGQFYYIDKQQSTLTSEEVKQNNTVSTQQPNLSLSKVKQNTLMLLPPKVDKQNNEPGKIRQIKTKQPNSPSGEVKHDEKQQYLQTIPNSNTVKVVRHLINLNDSAHDVKFKSYVKNLSSSQVNDVVKYMGVGGLTSRKSQEQFLKCAGMKLLLKQLKDKPPNSSIQIPLSFQHCKNMSFKSSKSRALLESVAGSGNSYVRQLLESATGIYTGATYCDPAYLRVGMIGEGLETESVLVIKNHELSDPKALPKLYDKAIYIVRNPFDAILAEHNRGIAHANKNKDEHTAVVDYNYGMYHYYMLLYVHTLATVYCLYVCIKCIPIMVGLGLRSWNIAIASYCTYMCIGYLDCNM